MLIYQKTVKKPVIINSKALDENTKKEFELAKSNTLFLQISYENDNNEITDIKIPLKLIKKYLITN